MVARLGESRHSLRRRDAFVRHPRPAEARTGIPAPAGEGDAAG